MDIMSYLLGQNSGGAKKGMRVVVVDELPATGETNVLYLVPKEDTGDNDIFEEWLYVENEWEKIGSTDIDLSNYYTKSETDAKIVVQPLNIGNIADVSAYDLSINDVIASKYGEGNYGVYLLKAHITANQIDANIGILNCSEDIVGTLQEIILFKGRGSNVANTTAYRTINNTTGNVTSGVNFTDTYMDLYTYSQSGKTSVTSTDHTIVRGKDLSTLYGNKGIGDLSTTTKTSIIDAINEVNSQIGNINTVLATLTTPSNGGA